VLRRVFDVWERRLLVFEWRRILAHSFKSGVAAAAFLSSAAVADTPDCKNVSVSARAPEGSNLVPPQTYNTEDVAKKNAIKAWEELVAQHCPGYAPQWNKAKAHQTQCEGYAGGISCDVSAQPGH
jgi:hypothetical protein